MLTGCRPYGNVPTDGTASTNYCADTDLAGGPEGTGYPAPTLGGVGRSNPHDHAGVLGRIPANTPRGPVEARASPWGAGQVRPQVTELTLPDQPQEPRNRGGSGSGLTYPTPERLRTRCKGDHGVPADRLARSYIVETSGCWRWVKGTTGSGYGHFSLGSVYYQAHVIVWIVERGMPPAGLEPDHLCRNRWCVNPDCIEWVTHVENIRRGSRTFLTPDEVEAILTSVAAGFSQRAVARAHGIDHSTVSRIVSGERWGDVTNRRTVAA
jgi:hypothetical protein